jgi:hypothetical protein
MYMWAPRREPDPKTKSSRSHLKISTNLIEICWRYLKMAVRYFVQIIIPRFTRGPHVESRTLKLKARVHTLKFQRICLKFVGNVLEWQSAILYNLVHLDPHIWCIWKMDFMWYRTGSRYKFGLVCGVLHHLVSLVWIHKRNGLDGVASNYFSFMYGLVWFWGGSQTIGSLSCVFFCLRGLPL